MILSINVDILLSFVGIYFAKMFSSAEMTLQTQVDGYPMESEKIGQYQDKESVKKIQHAFSAPPPFSDHSSLIESLSNQSDLITGTENQASPSFPSKSSQSGDGETKAGFGQDHKREQQLKIENKQTAASLHADTPTPLHDNPNCVNSPTAVSKSKAEQEQTARQKSSTQPEDTEILSNVSASLPQGHGHSNSLQSQFSHPVRNEMECEQANSSAAAAELRPTTQFETTVTETHANAPAFSLQVLGHLDSFQLCLPSHHHRPQTSYDAESEPDYHEVKLACQCLHANDFSKMAEVLSPARSTVAVNFGLGLAHYKMRNFPSAIKHFVKMEDIAYADNRQVGNVYLSLYYRGEISFAKQTYLEAADLFSRSVAVFSTDTVAKRYRITSPSRSVVYAKEGASYRHAQQVLEAVKAYKNAISTAKSKRDKLSACTSLGNMYQGLGKNVLALAQYKTTIELAKELQDHVSLGWPMGTWDMRISICSRRTKLSITSKKRWI